MEKQIEYLQSAVQELKDQITNLEERINEIEAVTIHESRRLVNLHFRQLRTIFFGFCTLGFVVAAVLAPAASQDEKFLYTLATGFGAATVANTSGALDSIAGDLWKSLKK